MSTGTEEEAPTGNPMQLAVAPLPTAITVMGSPDGGVILQVQTPQGVNVFFLSPEDAKAHTAHMQKATSGIVMPSPGDLASVVRPGV